MVVTGGGCAAEVLVVVRVTRVDEAVVVTTRVVTLELAVVTKRMTRARISACGERVSCICG